jgi:DNA-binding MarR family transcriptional regulator
MIRLPQKLDFEMSPCFASATRKASRHLAQLYDSAIEPCGLKTTQYSILAEVNRQSKGPPTIIELAYALVLERSALGHNLKPLVRDGFITLRGGEKDRRRRYVVLTRRGMAKYQQAKRLWQEAQDRFRKVFGESQAVKLRETLLSIAFDERLAKLKD